MCTRIRGLEAISEDGGNDALSVEAVNFESVLVGGNHLLSVSKTLGAQETITHPWIVEVAASSPSPLKSQPFHYTSLEELSDVGSE